MNRALWTLGTLCGIAASYYLVLGRLHTNQMANLNRDIDASYASVDQAEVDAAQVMHLQKIVQDLERWQQDLKARLALDPAAPTALMATRLLLQQAGLVVDRAEAMGPDPNLALPNQQVRLVVTGEFANLFAAIRGLEDSAAPTRISHLAIRATADPQRVHAELTLVRAWSLE